MKTEDMKQKLEREWHRKVTWTEWRTIERRGLISDYQASPLETDDERWWEFREGAKLACAETQRILADNISEQAGEIQSEAEPGPEEAAPDNIPPPSASLSSRTTARARALSAYNRLHAGDEAWRKAIASGRSLIHSTHKPRGGVDGTLPQWVIFMGIEAWVPAEEVKEAYRAHQQALLAEQKPPRTKERAFEVAAFVWDQERVHGKRPSWAELCRRWNNLPLTEPFKSSAAAAEFQSNFRRGSKATAPRYSMSNERLTEAVRFRADEGIFNGWVASFRK
jgi:hypothetical protein